MQWIKWRPGQLARNGTMLLAWMVLRAIMQAAIVILLARKLGAQSYGQFVAAIAVASFFVPFAGLGMSYLVLRNCARDAKHHRFYFTRALSWWWYSLPICAIAAIGTAIGLLPPGLPHTAAFVAIISELIATSMTELQARNRQAQQRMNAYGAITAALPTVRLLAFGLLFLVDARASVATVFEIFAASSVAYALALGVLRSDLRRVNGSPGIEPMTPQAALPFSLAGFSARVQTEFNKPILAQVAFSLAGTYNVAQRVTDLASLPLNAMQEALWPRLYAQRDPSQQLRRTGSALVGLALGGGGVLWLAAPLVPIILGDSFGGAVNVLRLLAWLPAVQLVRNLINFHIIHRAWMSLIGWAYAIGATLGVLLVVDLVPRWGLDGAIVASYGTEAAMIATLLNGTWWKHRNARKGSR